MEIWVWPWFSPGELDHSLKRGAHADAVSALVHTRRRATTTASMRLSAGQTNRKSAATIEEARVRSSPNLRYCRALHSIIGDAARSVPCSALGAHGGTTVDQFWVQYFASHSSGVRGWSCEDTIRLRQPQSQRVRLKLSGSMISCNSNDQCLYAGASSFRPNDLALPQSARRLTTSIQNLEL